MSASEAIDAHENGGPPAFPFPTAVPYEPPEDFARLRATCPVSQVRLPTGDLAWLVTRFRDNRTVLADARFSRAAAARRGAPRARFIPLDERAITALDPPEHSRLRRLVGPAFTGVQVKRLEPFVMSTAERLVADLMDAGPPADFVTIVAAPYALEVIGALLGLPPLAHGRLKELTDGYLSVDSHPPEQMRQCVEALRALLADQVARRREEPADDLIGILLDGGLDDETIVTFGVTLLVAGYETVVAHLTSSLLVLLRHPQQLAWLRQRPELLESAVEELLRYTAISPSGGTLRVATADVELGGMLIRAGEAVLPSTVAANRDPAVFTAPDRLDLGREGARHLAFGHGAHRCLGAGLARLELRVALAALLDRLPDVRLAVDAQELDWNRRKMIRGMSALPLAW